ncbi:9112_t:CDS:2, partial [Paraglomus occultum]
PTVKPAPTAQLTSQLVPKEPQQKMAVEMPMKSVYKMMEHTKSLTMAELIDTTLTELMLLTPKQSQQAAALYNGSPQVLGSELSKGTGNKVKYNGVDYDATNTAGIIAAKKAKIDSDNAARLDNAKTTAINAIQALMDDTSDNKTKLTDEEGYIEAATTTAEVSSRESKVKEAITALREAKKLIPFDAAVARAAAITAFEDKDNKTDIDSKKKELTDKIDAERAKEPKKEPPKEKLTDEKVEQVIQTVLSNTSVKPQPKVVKSWQSYDSADSQLRTAEQIQEFLEEIKDKEADFAKILEEMPDENKPVGNTPEEKVDNFLSTQKAEVVVKAIFSYKIKDDTFRNETEAEMKTRKNVEEQQLDEKVYPKKDGKYTKEAMVRYLFEKKTGQTHQFAAKGQDSGSNLTTEGH